MRCAEASAPSLGPAQKTTRPAGSRALARAHAETQSPRGSSSGSALSYRLRSYSIRPGDDIYTICKRKGIDVESVQALNKKVNVVEAKPGDVILLPIKGALSERDKEILGGLSATGPRQYVVAEGETASQIAAERDIPMSEVAKLNPKTNLKKLKGGQKLLLPNGYYTKQERMMLRDVLPVEKPPVLDTVTKVELGALSLVLMAGAILFSKRRGYSGGSHQAAVREGRPA